MLHWLTIVTVVPMMFGGSINPVFGLFSTSNKLRIPALVLLGAGILNTTVVFILLKTTNMGIWAIAITGAVQGGLRNALFTPIYGASCIGQKWYSFFPTMLKAILGLSFVVVTGFAFKTFMPNDSWLTLALTVMLTSITALSLNIFIIMNSNDRQYLKTIILQKNKEKTWIA